MGINASNNPTQCEPIVLTRYLGEFETLSALTTAHPTAAAGSYALVGSAIYFYSVTNSEWFTITSSGSSSPIPYGELRLKAKGDGNVDPQLEIGDIVEGFKDATTYWSAAVYNGGDAIDRANYTPLVEITLT